LLAKKNCKGYVVNFECSLHENGVVTPSTQQGLTEPS